MAAARRGAVSSQNITLPSLGPQILSAIEAGASVEQAMKQALAEDRFREYRRWRRLTPTATQRCSAGVHPRDRRRHGGDNCVAAGNMLASQGVIAAMVGAFEAATGELASRLLAGLRAGIVAGARPARSTRRR